ncbi:MAG: hypothetical protein GQ525_02715 [Draconibacterium sp.]|nr:hypothetical protein [Draconibacterium sp.]
MKIRIHHFFDIIRDFGSGKNITPHPSLHAYHEVAEQIRENPNIEFEIVVQSDAVCTGCVHLDKSICDDTISHRKDFTLKEEFNNYLDRRIVDVCIIQLSEKYTPKMLCEIAHKYIDNIEFIYEGNDIKNTELRKQNVVRGLKYYSQKHEF